MSPRRGREFWVRAVSELEQSGLSHSEFAQNRHINVGTLRSWLYRLRRERDRRPGIRMLPVRLAAADAIAGGRFVEIGVGGTVLRVEVGVDTEYVAELVTRLRERC